MIMIAIPLCDGYRGNVLDKSIKLKTKMKLHEYD